MHSFIQILSTPSSDSVVPSFMVHFEDRDYLFNAAEGIQRLASSRKIRLGRISDIFLCRSTWDGSGGLIGLLLTLSERNFSTSSDFCPSTIELKADTNEPDNQQQSTMAIPVHAPRGLRAILSASRSFIFRKSLAVEVNEIDRLIPASDSNWQVIPIDNGNSASFMCISHKIKGKFHAQKAIKLGVKPGPDFGKLCNGHTVMVQRGDVWEPVKPDEVIGPERPGAIFMVLDFANEIMLESFIQGHSHDRVSNHSGLCIFMYFLGQDFNGNYSKLAEWIEMVGEKGRHFIFDSATCNNNVANQDWAKTQRKLNMVDPTIFPLPQEWKENLVSEENLRSQLPQGPQWDNRIYINPPSSMRIDMEPNFQVINEVEATEEEEEEAAAAADDDDLTLDADFEAAINVAKNNLLKCEKQSVQNIEHPDLEVITLGTGSAVPSKYRNVSGNMIRIPGKGSIILDCGENTLAQLSRLYGSELKSVLGDIRCIFISHLHADHHLGVLSVVSEILKLTDKSLYVYGPARYRTFLQEYQNQFDFDPTQQIKFIPSITYMSEGNLNEYKGQSADFHSQMCEQLGLKSWRTVEVIHCFQAFGIVFETDQGAKIVYSGDTRPSQLLEQAGEGATLVLHEATFEESMQTEAVKKRHSTTAEAIATATAMGAKCILLTHFSQRYPKLPQYLFEEKMSKPNSPNNAIVSVAFDLMRVRLGEFWKLPELFEPIRVLYREEEQIMKNGKKRKSSDEGDEGLEKLKTFRKGN